MRLNPTHPIRPWEYYALHKGKSFTEQAGEAMRKASGGGAEPKPIPAKRKVPVKKRALGARGGMVGPVRQAPGGVVGTKSLLGSGG
jgi:ribosomal protein L44E